MRPACAKWHSPVRPIFFFLLVCLASVRLFSETTRTPGTSVNELLWDAEDEASQLASDADQMQALLLSDRHWLTHELMLHKIQGHVEDMKLLIEKLSSSEGSGSALQEQAVQRILPLIRELSENTSSAIGYLNQNKSRPLSETYARYLKKNAETAHELSTMVSSLVDYQESMNEMTQLRRQLAAENQ